MWRLEPVEAFEVVPWRALALFRLTTLVYALISTVHNAVLFPHPFGAWLVSAENLRWGDAWLTWGLALLVISLALGGLGGRPLRQARELAERLVTLGDQRSPELRRAVANPVGLALNYGSLAASLALLGLMIWKPV